MTKEKCPTCNKPLIETVGDVSFPIEKKKVIVKELPHLKCSSCNEMVFTHESQRIIEKTFYGKKRQVA